MTETFDWQRLLLGDETPLSFLWEIAFRSVVMYVLLLLVLRMLGKRGVGELSILEVAIIISLGSSSGDPMFYQDVPLLHGALVLVVVLLCHRGFTWLAQQSARLETIIENEAELIVEDGEMIWKNFDNEDIARNEFFASLRMMGIEHLGQVKRSYLEANGQISVFKRTKKEVKPGLPIFPEQLKNPLFRIDKPGEYACIHCAHTEQIPPTASHLCPVCARNHWLPVNESTQGLEE